MDLDAIADALIDVNERAATMTPMSETTPDFDSAAAYAVLDLITSRRTRNGWTPAGRKIGFTNRTIWELYGIERPMWAPVWEQTVRHADANMAALSLARLVQPRIEPEVVFKLRRPVAAVDRPEDLIDAVEWIAPGFEIVHCHFPGWRFALADCTADFGLHGALVVGTPVEVNDSNAAAIVASLPEFELALARDGTVVDRGVGANVLGGPVHALAHLVDVLADRPDHSLQAGEIITTGTVTDAQAILPGETWTSDYGVLGLDGLTIEFS